MSMGIRPFLRSLLWAWLAFLAFAMLSVPAGAHEKKKHRQQQQTEQVQPAATNGAEGSAAMQPGTATDAHGGMGEMMEDGEDRSGMSFPVRLLNWIGRLHPSIVHFPIAFFPAAAFTAIMGRRRPAFGTPVRFLVIAGGIIAPIAAIMGWLDAIAEDPSPLLTVHRWLGTSIGIGGLLLAIWAWRRPDQNRSPGMIGALVLITAALIAQGWYGGAMVHGIEHLNW